MTQEVTNQFATATKILLDVFNKNNPKVILDENTADAANFCIRGVLIAFMVKQAALECGVTIEKAVEKAQEEGIFDEMGINPEDAAGIIGAFDGIL